LPVTNRQLQASDDGEITVICHNCGGELEKIITDLPFKVRTDSIVIIKNLPVLQCYNCHEYLIEDPVMEKMDSILEKIDKTAELEVLNYAV
jgi:YgiT-type zinc finger domain-containing protein